MAGRASELEIIEYIRKRFPVRNKEIVTGIGDDAMVFRNGQVITMDAFFEHTHFNRAYFSMRAIGHHTMAATLSDLAAMGARPLCALISLYLTEQMSLKDIRGLYDGFIGLSKKYAFDISGGDVVQGPGFGLSITAIGKARRVIKRSGAQPGHGLYVTNFLGLAEVGRHVLQDKLPEKDFHDAIKQHLYPEPRIKEAALIKQYVSACIDTSDGLSTDALHLAQESGVSIVIEAQHVPVHSEVGEYCAIKSIDPLDHILASGEDFELLFTSRHIPRITKVQIFKIGHVEKGTGLYLVKKGKKTALAATGYEHLKPQTGGSKH